MTIFVQHELKSPQVHFVVVVRVGRCGTMTTYSGAVTSTTVLISPRRRW